MAAAAALAAYMLASSWAFTMFFLYLILLLPNQLLTWKLGELELIVNNDSMYTRMMGQFWPQVLHFTVSYFSDGYKVY